MANSWWEIQVLGEPALEDIAFWRLEEFGCKGTSSEVKSHACLIKAYLLEEKAKLLDLAALSLLLRQDALCAGLSPPVTQWHLIDEEDWSSSWKAHWQPQEIGDRLLINPAWLPVPVDTDRLVLQLDPGVAFGTGAHATTQLCLEALEMRLSDPDATDITIADVGCGTGILSIGSILLGAAKAYAVDVDPLAVRSTLASCELNQIPPDRLVVAEGSIETMIELTQGPVDGIVCNILADVIIQLIPAMSAIVKPTTWGILSGILLDQVKPVADTLEQNGWLVATLWRKQEWCCLNIRRS